MTRRGQAGFTLLEMLLAIALLVLLAGLAYGTLRTGVRGWEAAGTQAERQDAMRVAWPFLHQTLESARPARTATGNDIDFNGDATQLDWIAELPAHFAAGGPQRLQLVTKDQDGRHTLVLRSTPVDATAADQTREAVLVDRLAGIDISYYGNDGDGASRWQTAWQDRRVLPQLVRIDVRPADEPAWPSLYAHPYLAGPAPVAQAEGDDAADAERRD